MECGWVEQVEHMDRLPAQVAVELSTGWESAQPRQLPEEVSDHAQGDPDVSVSVAQVNVTCPRLRLKMLAAS